MKSKTPIEERIARFLEEHDITIISGHVMGSVASLNYMQLSHDRTIRKLGRMVYDTTTGESKEEITPEELSQRQRLKNFANVTGPLAQLLRENEGNYASAQNTRPIREVCEKVEKRYNLVWDMVTQSYAYGWESE